MATSSTLASVKQALLDKQEELISSATSLQDLSYITKAIADSEKIVSDDTPTAVIDPNAPYGVMIDTVTGESHTVGHNILTVHSQMRRCVCNGNPAHGGQVMYYLNKDDSTKKEDGTPAEIYGENGYQVLVEIPRFYTKRYGIGAYQYSIIATEPFEGSKTHTLFKRDGWTDSGNGTDEEHEVAYDYKSAFEMSRFDNALGAFVDGINSSDTTGDVDLVNDSLKSVAGKKPWVGLTRAENRTLIENGGGKQFNYWQWDALCLLALIEFKTHNWQEFAEGYTEESSFNYDANVVYTGITVSLGNKSGSITGKASDNGGTDTTNQVISMSYRGIENFFGHLWQFVDGVNISNWKPYLIKTVDLTFTDDTFTGDYLQARDSESQLIVMPNANGYQSQVYNGTMLPKSIYGSSAGVIGDYYYQSLNNRVFRSGSNLYGGRQAGAESVGANSASSDSSVDICGR